jgi:hypothetical protein
MTDSGQKKRRVAWVMSSLSAGFGLLVLLMVLASQYVPAPDGAFDSEVVVLVVLGVFLGSLALSLSFGVLTYRDWDRLAAGPARMFGKLLCFSGIAMSLVGCAAIAAGFML